MPETNGWTEWRNHVLKELERLNSCYDSLDEKMDDLGKEIVALKVKAGAWGLVAGCIPVAIALVIRWGSGN